MLDDRNDYTLALFVLFMAAASLIVQLVLNP
jgi:hypothetical protein